MTSDWESQDRHGKEQVDISVYAILFSSCADSGSEHDFQGQNLPKQNILNQQEFAKKMQKIAKISTKSAYFYSTALWADFVAKFVHA